ncbi:MAG: MBL fold metallo-hydrolase [Pseudomonadota bacterium]
MSEKLEFIILGCGSSGGVPRIGGHWGVCDPNNPKNRRRRCSALVRKTAENGDQTHVLIDTSPDIRDQLLDAGVGWLDGVIFTHEHADHTHGIDDLRVIAINGRNRVQTYADTNCAATLRDRFAYCFETPEGSLYPPILKLDEIEGGQTLTVSGAGGDIDLTVFDQVHGNINSLGVRVAGLAYSSDLSDIPDGSIPHLEGLDVWVVDALRPTPHVSHFSLPDALSWIERLSPNRAILTNMHVDLDYKSVNDDTPVHVEAAYDMMTVELNGVSD